MTVFVLSEYRAYGTRSDELGWSLLSSRMWRHLMGDNNEIQKTIILSASPFSSTRNKRLYEKKSLDYLKKFRSLSIHIRPLTVHLRSQPVHFRKLPINFRPPYVYLGFIFCHLVHFWGLPGHFRSLVILHTLAILNNKSKTFVKSYISSIVQCPIFKKYVRLFWERVRLTQIRCFHNWPVEVPEKSAFSNGCDILMDFDWPTQNNI